MKRNISSCVNYVNKLFESIALGENIYYLDQKKYISSPPFFQTFGPLAYIVIKPIIISAV